MGSSCIRALSNNPSSPVGFSGAKNRWGRNQLLSLHLFGAGLVGVQSISSLFDPSSLATIGGGVPEPGREGKPKTGLTRVITGFEDRDRERRASCSEIAGNFGTVGVSV